MLHLADLCQGAVVHNACLERLSLKHYITGLYKSEHLGVSAQFSLQFV